MFNSFVNFLIWPLEISLYLTRSPRDSNWEGRVENDQNFKSSPTWLRSYKKYIKRKIENKEDTYFI